MRRDRSKKPGELGRQKPGDRDTIAVSDRIGEIVLNLEGKVTQTLISLGSWTSQREEQ